MINASISKQHWFMTSLVHLPLLCSIWTVIKYKIIVHTSLLIFHSVSTCLRAYYKTTIEEMSMDDIDLDNCQCGHKQTVKCKIVSVDLDTLWEKILCPKCKSEITLDGGLANCEKCRTLSVESICIRQSKVQLIASSAAGN